MVATVTVAGTPPTLYEVLRRLEGLTEWRVTLTPAEAETWAAKVEGYNEHTGADILALVKTINTLMPRMQFGPGNPNNGAPAHRISVGNEGSRVMYVAIGKGYRPQWTGTEWTTLARLFEEARRAAHADEAWVVTDDEEDWEYRFWWD
jgi:hypothetical protein